MANGQHGGYRKPTNPAPASGPGALSRRTDGRQPTSDLPNAKYGENAAFRDAQAAAPMSETGPDLSQITPFGAPSQRPDEPISAGMPGGLGAGPAMPTSAPTITPDQANRLRSYLPVLIQLASREDADPNTRQYVRQLRAELG